MEDGRSITVPLIAQRLEGPMEMCSFVSRAAIHGISNYRPEIPSKMDPLHGLLCFLNAALSSFDYRIEPVNTAFYLIAT